jgi:hypothetical protein
MSSIDLTIEHAVFVNQPVYPIVVGASEESEDDEDGKNGDSEEISG